MNDDTIAAISTPLGEGAIGIVRLSGKDSLKIADKIFQAKDGILPSKFKSHTLHYGWIVEKSKFISSSEKKNKQKSNIIDEVLLTVMRSPRTYTKEDIVEINCHGGLVALQKVLELVIRNGARIAEPGEFTKRAFLNGRIDLSKAEAVLDIIRAKTDTALKLSIQQLKGALSERIRDIRKKVIDILAQIEASIDFPEEDIETKSYRVLKPQLEKIVSDLDNIISDYQKTKFFRDGIKVTICGRPNVGKSSLLNAILKKERAIVTPVAGTTRDVIEEFINIRGVGIRLVDTAGLLEPKNLIEHHSIRLTKDAIALSDIVLLLFDANSKLTPKDFALMDQLDNKRVIAVLNKIDLPLRIQKDKIRDKFKRLVSISALKQINLDKLENEIIDFIYNGKSFSPEATVMTNYRQITLIEQTRSLFIKAINSMLNKLSGEFVALDLKLGLDCLGKIIGETVDDAILEKIFSEFCIGK